MDKISVIVPIYNMENYLEKCVQTILNQTYTNLEIILVDDGSKDSSGEICDKIAQKDSRVKVLHTLNSGLSVARNNGLDMATGKYIMFMDADDFYENNSCEVLYNEIVNKDADYVIGNYIHTNYNGEKWPKPLFDVNIYDNFELSIKDYKKSFFVMNSVVWNKIFKRDFIEKYNLRFVPNAIAEDAIFSTFCYVHATKAYYIKDVVYNYRQNRNNSSISTNCSKEYFLRINSSYKMLYDNFKNSNEMGFFRYFYARITPYLLCKIVDTNQLSDEEIKEILQKFKWYFNIKNEYHVTILSRYLDIIIDNVSNDDYEEALKNIKVAKEYRKTLDDIQKERMYSPNEKLYVEMSKCDNMY